MNCGVSDDNNLDNAMSRNNAVQDGDAVNLTHGNVSGTGSMDGATVEKSSKRGRESPNPPSIGIIDATGEVVKSCGRTGKIDLDCNKNGGSADEKNAGAVKKGKLTGRTDNEELDVNNGHKDFEEGITSKGKAVHGVYRALHGVTERGDVIDESPAHKGGTERKEI